MRRSQTTRALALALRSLSRWGAAFALGESTSDHPGAWTHVRPWLASVRRAQEQQRITAEDYASLVLELGQAMAATRRERPAASRQVDGESCRTVDSPRVLRAYVAALRERISEVERENAAAAEDATRQRDRAKRAELELERVTRERDVRDATAREYAAEAVSLRAMLTATRLEADDLRAQRETLLRERDEAREVASRNARDCEHLRQSAITLENERDEARETARLVADALDDDCLEHGYGRYSREILSAVDRALAYPRGGGK